MNPDLIHVTVSNPLPARTEFCQDHEGCKHPAQMRFLRTWLCNYHFYRAYRALEMNSDSPEAA